MDLLPELLDVSDAKCHRRLQRAGEGGVIAPPRVTGQLRVLPSVGNNDVPGIAGIPEGVKGDPVRSTIARRFAEGDQYEQLFDIRSAFLHGRAMMDISTQEQVMARSLARQVVEALILATQSGQIPSREDFLDSLLDKGAPLI